MATKKNVRDHQRLLLGLRVALLALAVLGMVLTTGVGDLLWRRAVIAQARNEVQRMAVLLAARASQDAHELGQVEALARLRETLAMPTGGMGFHVVLLSPDWRVLASTIGAPVEEGDYWPAAAAIHGQVSDEVEVAGQRCVAASVKVAGTKWAMVVIEPRARILPDTAISHWLVLIAAALAVLALGVVLHNVALRARAEEAAGQAEKAAEGAVHVLDGLAVAGIVNAQSGQIVAANQGLAQLLGFERPELVEGQQWYGFFDAYIASRYQDLFLQALTHGVSRANEVPHPDGRGDTRYLDLFAKRLWVGQPEVVFLAEDVTERRMMQEELARRAREYERRGRQLEEQLARTVAAAARYRNLVTHSPDPVIVVDARTHRIVEANPQAERELGMTYDQLRAATLSVLDASRGLRIEELLEQAKREGVVRDAELVMPTARGAPPKYVACTVSYLVAGEEELFHIILRDITTERLVRAEVEEAYQRMAAQARRLEEVNEQLRRATEAKSYFLATMSHELRAPLNSIIGFTELLLDETYGKLNERQREFLNDVQRASGHLLKLINDVLELARMEAGRITLQPAPVGVNQLLREVYSLTRGAAAEKNQHLEFSVQPHDLMVFADEQRAKQILTNLISNAIKYSPPDTSIRVGAQVSGDTVVFSVADQGPGIAPEDQERIFREFERVERGSYPATSGFGLGLPITKYLVERHGGRIWVESALGAGSTFYFTLPRFLPSLEQQVQLSAALEGRQATEQDLAGQPVEQRDSAQG